MKADDILWRLSAWLFKAALFFVPFTVIMSLVDRYNKYRVVERVDGDQSISLTLSRHGHLFRTNCTVYEICSELKVGDRYDMTRSENIIQFSMPVPGSTKDRRYGAVSIEQESLQP